MKNFRFYCPLKAGTWEGFDEEELQYAEEMRSVDSWAYEDEIREAVKRENERLDEGGLAPYIHEADLRAKVKNITPAVEVIGEDLYGVMEVELNADLSPEELENLRQYCIGQASDGWGESAEQHPIDTPDGEIYVSFWNSDGGYFMLTDDEFDAKMDIRRDDHQPEMSVEPSIEQRFLSKIFNNYKAFKDEWSQLGINEIIRKAKEIAVTDEMYDLLQCSGDADKYEAALLKFENPLMVVRDIYLERQRDGETPDIHEILEFAATNKQLETTYYLDAAYTPPEVTESAEPSVHQQFEKKLLNNYTDYIGERLTESPSKLIEGAEDIALVKQTYDALVCGVDYDYAEYLLRFENPLTVVCDQRRAEQELGGDDSVDHALWDLLDKPDLTLEYALDIDWFKEQFGDSYKFTAEYDLDTARSIISRGDESHFGDVPFVLEVGMVDIEVEILKNDDRMYADYNVCVQIGEGNWVTHGSLPDEVNFNVPDIEAEMFRLLDGYVNEHGLSYTEYNEMNMEQDQDMGMQG